MRTIDYVWGGLIALAIILVLVKPQAQTPAVVNAVGSNTNDLFKTLTNV